MAEHSARRVRQRYLCHEGGTAINLFLRDMPRLSVDIGLCLDRELSDCRRLHRFDVHRQPAGPSAKTVAVFTRGLRRSGRWTGSPRQQQVRRRTGIRLRLPPGEGGGLDVVGDEHRGSEF